MKVALQTSLLRIPYITYLLIHQLGDQGARLVSLLYRQQSKKKTSLNALIVTLMYRHVNSTTATRSQQNPLPSSGEPRILPPFAVKLSISIVSTKTKRWEGRAGFRIDCQLMKSGKINYPTQLPLSIRDR